jgi:hypothetical protein
VIATQDSPSIIHQIPDPALIQRRLSELAREERTLRRLLRVALDVRRDREQVTDPTGREVAVAK